MNSNEEQLPGQEALLAQLHKLHPSRACPRWAVLGPRYSGKSQFLSDFTEACKRDKDSRSPIPIHLDLKRLGLDTEECMYRGVFQQLEMACRDLPFQVSSDGPLDGTGRFDHLVRDLLTAAKSRVALVVDHLDSVPHFFGRSLLRRFRLMVDQQDLCHEYRNLCLLLAGSTSLYDLRRTGDSAFIASNLIFPRRSETSWKKYVGSNGKVTAKVQAKILQETGGESLFLDLLFNELDLSRPLTFDRIEEAVERLLNSPEPHDSLHQMVLQLVNDPELQRLVRDLANARGGRIIRRDSSPDIDHFCLSGIVVLLKEQSFAFYRFRNGIVERFARRFLNESGSPNAHFPSVAVVADTRAECYHSRDFSIATKKLLSAWPACVFDIEPPFAVALHVRYHESKFERWIDPSRRSVAEVSVLETLPISALWAVKLANESSPPHHAFSFHERSISLAVPFSRSEASMELVLSFHPELAGGISENSLSHWLRLLDDCWPSLAAAALSELSVCFIKQIEEANLPAIRTPTLDSKTRIHWVPSYGVILDQPGKCTHYPIGGALTKIQRTVDDLNQRCLKMMVRGRTPAEFGAELRGVADQLQNFLEDCCPGLVHDLHAPADLVFVSDLDGLKLPIELLPLHASNLALDSPLARRLCDATPSLTNRSFAECINGLIAEGETLKVMLIGADPQSSLRNLDDELKQLKEKIEQSCALSRLSCKVHVIEPIDATRKTIERRLKDKTAAPYHILHFCGHGEQASHDAESSLILSGKQGEADRLTCEQLKFLLKDRVLWLAYLSCCYGAAARGSVGIDQQYVGTMQAVLDAGIPNSVGFRWAVTDAGAYALALSFYENLLAPERLFNPSGAMWEARRSVAGDTDKRDAWASAMLLSQCG